MAAWIALLRLARRDIRRSRWHATLVIALVALPVMGLVVQGTLRATAQPTPAQVAARELGAAALAIYSPYASAGAGDTNGDGALDGPPHPLPTPMPAGATVEPVWRGALTLTPSAPTPDGTPTPSATITRSVEALGVDLDGLGRGMVEVVDGRPPRAGNAEIAVTTALAQPLGLGVGDQVQTDVGTRRIAGLLRDPVAVDRQLAVMPADDVDRPSGVLVAAPEEVVVTLTRSSEQAGADVVTRAELARPDTEQTALNVAMGGFAFLLTSFVAAAAFAVSAQRRRHDLALLAATGADARHLRRSVLATAIVLGGSGAVLGAAAGVVVSAATLPWLEQWTNRAVDGLMLQPLLLVASVATGLAAAVSATALTARAAGRTPVAAALSDRRPSTTSSNRLLLTGIGCLTAGAAVTLVTASDAATNDVILTAFGLLIGAALLMLGLGAVSPWLVERFTALVGARVPVGVRLALRDTARFRSRTGPIVMAIVAGLGISVAASAVLETIETALASEYRPLLADDQVLVDGPAAAPLVEQLREELDVRAAAPLTYAQPIDPSTQQPQPFAVTVADARLLDVLGAPGAAEEALGAGQVLVLEQRGRARDLTTRQRAEVFAPDGVRVIDLDLVPDAVPPILLTRSTLERSGAGVAEQGDSWLLRLAGPPTNAQLAGALELASGAGQRIVVESGPMNVDTVSLQTVAVVAAAVLSLLIVAVGLALLGAETRRDDAVLTAVGAAPHTLRALAAARAGALTLIGGILAVPAGLVPVWGSSALAVNGLAAGKLTVPWAVVGAVVLLVPTIAAAGAYLLARADRVSLDLGSAA